MAFRFRLVFLSDFRSSLSKAFDNTKLAMPQAQDKQKNTCFEKYVFALVAYTLNRETIKRVKVYGYSLDFFNGSILMFYSAIISSIILAKGEFR